MATEQPTTMTAERFKDIARMCDMAIAETFPAVEGRELVAEVRWLRSLLGEWADLHDSACRFDHHGVCQAHFVEKDCIVDRTRGALGRWRLRLEGAGDPHERREGEG